MNLKDKTLWQRNAAAIGGMVLFAAGINFFIVPASLYNGGVLGISQIIRTLLIQVFPSLASGTDIAGIINFILKYTFIYHGIYLNRQKFLQPDTGLPDQSDDILKYISNSGYTSGQ